MIVLLAIGKAYRFISSASTPQKAIQIKVLTAFADKVANDGESYYDQHMREHETQQSITDWIKESYPEASINRKLTHLFEEVTELAVSAKSGLELRKVLDVVIHAWAKSQTSEQNAGAEIADTRISLSGLASALGINEQDVLDVKMAENRARSLQERQAREAAKQSLNIFRN